MSEIKYPADANRVRGISTRLWARGVVAAHRSAKVPENTPCGPARTISGRDEITPPLLTDAERGIGDSINARLHRIIGKYRDMT